MCGIAGFLANGIAPTDMSSTLAAMTDSLEHRGPDDSGTWIDTSAGVALGHRRLAVVELSLAGSQPMRSPQGRFILVFNGEIYNHLDLRTELERSSGVVHWKGHSDTETLLACFERWGTEETLRRTVGMFALALWDRNQRVLTLARDRFGEKPLYYAWVRSGLLFASELKAVRAHPDFAGTVSREALSQFLRFAYVPAPRSIYTDVYKLEPGCLLSIRETAPQAPPRGPLRPDTEYATMRLRRWWSLADAARDGQAHMLHSEDEALELLEERVREAVRIQACADVPLGAFLSGGFDSSTIVAFMQEQSARQVKTFTVSFEEADFDEAPHAKAVADHLGTEHSEIRVTSSEARSVVPLLPSMYDEPFADSSQIPTHLVSRFARTQVTVALSGDAGDELFGGYNRYSWAPSIWSRARLVPDWIRDALCTAAEGIPAHAWDRIGAMWSPREGRGVVRLGEKVSKLATSMSGTRSIDDLYGNLVSQWRWPARLLSEGAEHCNAPTLLQDPVPARALGDDQLRMMYWDSITYLPDDILCKVDRAAMAVSLETRVPFLDHRVAELAWRLPVHMKIREGQGKWALRQLLYRRVPKHLIDRPKAGFALPISQWLRGPLKDWAESLLDAGRLQGEGFLEPGLIREAWNQHLAGRDHTGKIWSVLMFQSWLEANG